MKGLKVVLRKIQVTKLKRFLSRAIADKSSAKKPSSWMGISHGYQLIENDTSEGSLIAQREQIENSEVWLFGSFDQGMGGKVSKYLQTHLFDKKLSKDQFKRKAKEAIKKAYITNRTKMQAQEEVHEIGGFTTAIVMSGERFVAADFGGYKAIVCKGGVGIQIGGRQQSRRKRHWFFSGVTGRFFGRKGDQEANRSAPFVIVAERVETETEFLILASDGIWEVLREQEAVDLISYIDDAQEAAECLAKEAFNRMSKSPISCIIIRFG